LATLASLSIDLVANSAKVVQEVKKANKARTAMEKTAKAVSRSIQLVVASFITGSFKQAATEAINTADQMGKLAQRLGSTSEALSELAYVAELSGLQFNTMTMGLQRMTRRIAEAAKGTGEAQGALAELNIDAAKLNQLAPEDQFTAIAQALSQVTGESDKVRLAMKLFDSEGVALLQTMGDGASGINAMREEARKMGATISGETAKDAALFNDELSRLQTRINAITRDITFGMIKALNDAGDAFTDFVGDETTVEGLEKKITRIADQMLRIEKGLVLNVQEGQFESLSAELARLQTLQDELLNPDLGDDDGGLLIKITGGKVEEQVEYVKTALEELLATTKDHLIEELAEIESMHAEGLLSEDEYWKAKQKIRSAYAKAELKDLKDKNKKEYLEERSSFNRQLAAAGRYGKAFYALQKINAMFEAALNAKKAALSAEAWGTALGGPMLGKVFKAISYASTAAEVAAIGGLTHGGGGGGGVPSGSAIDSPVPEIEVDAVDNEQTTPQTKTIIFNVEGIGDAELLPKSAVRGLIDMINEERESNVKVMI